MAVRVNIPATKSLILIRGLTGAGKSTIAKSILTGIHVGLQKPNLTRLHVESDMFFTLTGEYKFDTEKLGAAQDWCKKQVEQAMNHNINIITVSNDFIRISSMIPYYNLASAVDYDVQEITVKGNFLPHYTKPQDYVERSARHFQHRPQRFTLKEENGATII